MKVNTNDGCICSAKAARELLEGNKVVSCETLLL